MPHAAALFMLPGRDVPAHDALIPIQLRHVAVIAQLKEPNPCRRAAHTPENRVPHRHLSANTAAAVGFTARKDSTAYRSASITWFFLSSRIGRTCPVNLSVS
jgi:hypothetical protein